MDHARKLKFSSIVSDIFNERCQYCHASLILHSVGEICIVKHSSSALEHARAIILSKYTIILLGPIDTIYE